MEAALSTPFVGEIRLYSFGRVPKGWALCNGALLPINQNQALFSLLGTNYGGNGTTNFGLPDLQGRTPVYNGTQFVLGQKTGAENVTLLANQIPLHSHPMMGVNIVGTAAQPNSHAYANQTSGFAEPRYAPATSSPVALSPSTVQPAAGGSLPHTNMQPFLVGNYCIALVGIFPSRG
jgi:microcystin-dependent protein